LVAGGIGGWTTEPGRQFYVYAQEAVAETRKVVWPSRKETVQTTGMVLAFVLVMADLACGSWTRSWYGGVKLLMGPGA